jgi:hypothetical protein
VWCGGQCTRRPCAPSRRIGNRVTYSSRRADRTAWTVRRPARDEAPAVPGPRTLRAVTEGQPASRSRAPTSADGCRRRDSARASI